MKAITILLLSVSCLPKVLSAQPTVTLNEYYDVGSAVNMVYVDPTTVNVGAPGAAVTWDFTTVSASGGMATTTVANNASGIFSTSNLIITRPNGSIEFMAESSTDSYINAIIDHATHDTTTYDFYNFAKRPFGYLQSYLDTYKISGTMPATTGNGSMLITGDAWGTLKTPTGTYTNVLRIRKLRQETDTISAGEVSFTNISYLWFDAAHKAPLFEMDSVISTSDNTNKAMYLASPEGVGNFNASQLSYTGYLENNQLQLTGTFENGRTYDVVIYSVIGSKIYTGDFTASGTTQRIDVGRDLNPGIYIVSLTQRNDPSFNQVIKVVKQ